MYCDNRSPHDKHEYQRLFKRLVGRELSYDPRLITCPGVAPNDPSPEIEDDRNPNDYALAIELLRHQIARLAKMINETTDEYDKALLLAIKAQFSEKRWALRPGDSKEIRKIIYPNKGNRK